MDFALQACLTGILPKGKHTATWHGMFAVRAGGYELLYQSCRHAIATLTLSVYTFPTWAEYPDVVYRFAAAAIAFFRMDTTRVTHAKPLAFGLNSTYRLSGTLTMIRTSTSPESPIGLAASHPSTVGTP
jgi:hypothetical protein